MASENFIARLFLDLLENIPDTKLFKMDDNLSTRYCDVVAEMSNSMSAVKEAIQSIRANPLVLDMKEGISLLSLKHHTALSYLQSLVLVSSRRALGDSLSVRSPPSQPFSVPERTTRGGNLGDRVDSLIENRIVLEKIKTLEARMRYQIEKLVRIAGEPEKSTNFVDDPLTFRPNPENLNDEDDSEDGDAPTNHKTRHGDEPDPSIDEIYRPPRVAPVPYNEKSKSQMRKERPPIPSALTSLSSDPSRPHVESTSGLGSVPSLASGRAAYLKRLNDFEEDNFSRLIMKKADAKRRARDEEDLALGGGLGGSGRDRRRAGGLEDEFGDVLKSIRRGPTGGVGGGKGDGYEELRKRGRKMDVLERSRNDDGVRKRDRTLNVLEGNDGGEREKKRTRFELDAKNAKKKLKRK